MKKIVNLPNSLQELMSQDLDLSEKIYNGINLVYEEFNASNCTFHKVDEDGLFLSLIGQIGLPEKIAAVAVKIPVGKGMAGICAEKKEPVTMCNLQTDNSGVARPAAKETRVEGAVVVPLLNDSQEVIATIGIGKSEEYEYSEEELNCLGECARILMDSLST